MQGLPNHQKEKFIPPCDNISPDSGYIVFKDAKVVIFYTNDLNGTPSNPILEDSDEEASKHCRGLCKLYRWTRMEVLKRSSFLVPSPIIAYNQYMNGVDRMDQLRSTNITSRREKRLYMTMFTMVLDLAIHQAYSIYISSVPNETRRKHNSLTTFKQQVALSLLLPEMNKSQSAVSIFENPVQILPSEGPTSRGINETLGGISKIHMLLRNKGTKKNNSSAQDDPCYLCKLRGFISKTIYGCPLCKVGFHVECFTAFHYKDALKGNIRALMDMIKSSEMSDNRRNRKSSYVGTLGSIVLQEQ